MKLIKIKPSQIRLPEVRVTSVFTEEKEELLRDFLRKQGVIAPIVVQEIDGLVYLVDGKHRVDQLLAAGDHPVDAALIEGDMIDLLTRNLFLDHIRGDHRVGDMIRVLTKLYEDLGQGIEEIEAKTGLSRSYIEKILNISKAAPAVLEALDQGTIGVGHAAEIVRLPAWVQQEELVTKQTLFRFRVKDLKGFVDKVLSQMEEMAAQASAPAAAETPPPRTYNCEGCKSGVDPRYLKPVFLCPDCFGKVWRLAKAAQAQAQEVEVESGGD